MTGRKAPPGRREAVQERRTGPSLGESAVRGLVGPQIGVQEIEGHSPVLLDDEEIVQAAVERWIRAQPHVVMFVTAPGSVLGALCSCGWAHVPEEKDELAIRRAVKEHEEAGGGA